MRVLCQKGVSTQETRAIKMHCLMQSPAYCVRNAGLEELSTLELQEFDLIIGSVEFMQRCFELMKAKTPLNLSYPNELTSFLHRDIHLVRNENSLAYAEKHKPCFIKPTEVKAFTGFIYRGLDFQYDEHDKEQVEAFLAYPGDVWATNPIELQCEWRYYVQNNAVIGRARYDPEGLDEAPEPEFSVIKEAVQAYRSSPVAYTLDFGVDRDGRTVLIEANDAWAIGLYGKAMSCGQYFGFLHCRFSEIKGLSVH